MTADEAYIRESILTPTAKMVAGYQPLMPTFQGVVSEEQIAQLTAYIKSLAGRAAPRGARDAGGATGAAAAPTPRRRGAPAHSENDSWKPRSRKPTNYLNATHGAASWLLTKDHKRIALLYLIGVSFFFLIGGIFATLIRLELLTPRATSSSSETYNKFFTMHGVMMVFFFLIPSIPATLGNFLVPMMIGAKDLAFPRINLPELVHLHGRRPLRASAAMVAGGVDTGWTFYTPYSTAASNTHVVLTGLGIFITGFSSILTGLNFIVTIHTMRAPGMTWFRLPLFIWAHYATSLIMILGTPVIAITLLLVVLERALNLGIFDPTRGGDPVLFQHLFWFYSHPAVYIMVLPGMGVISELIAAFSRKPIFGYTFVAFSSLGIALRRLPRLGPPHVHEQPVGLRRADLLVPELPGRDPVGDQGVQLDGDALQGLDLVGVADALRDRLHRPVHDRRPDRPVPLGASASTSTCTTPTSWSRTSTTSWWAGRCSPISAACTTGGRR